jgi:ribose 5-phosphate isomerase RpiB
MKVSIASDHAGYRLKDRIAALVRDLGHEVAIRASSMLTLP